MLHRNESFVNRHLASGKLLLFRSLHLLFDVRLANWQGLVAFLSRGWKAEHQARHFFAPAEFPVLAVLEIHDLDIRGERIGPSGAGEKSCARGFVGAKMRAMKATGPARGAGFLPVSRVPLRWLLCFLR